jgi:DNA-binding transcriptional ArsR family regulator
MSGPLDLETRRRIVATVREYPGLHLRELARQLDTSLALVEYHVAILTQNGLVRSERDERYVRLFAKGDAQEPSPREREALGALRAKIPLQVTLYLLDQEGPIQHKTMVDALGLGKSKLSFHLRKLEAAGLVRKTGDGRFEPVDRVRLQALLLEYQPTKDLRSEFADLWENLYG